MSQVLLPPSPNWYGAHTAAASSDGNFVAYAAHNSVVVVSPGGHSVLGTLTGHSNRVTAVAFGHLLSGHSVLVSGAVDCTLRLWDPKARSCLGVVKKQQCPGEPSAILCCRGCAYIGDKGGRLLRWDLEERKTRLVHQRKAAVTCLAVLGEQPLQVAMGGADGVVTVAIEEWGGIMDLAAHKGEVQSLCWAALSSASVLVSGASDGRLRVSRIWSSGERMQCQLLHLLELPPPHAGLSKAQRSRLWLSAAWAPQDLPDFLPLVTASYAGQLHAWQIPTSAEVSPPLPVALPAGHIRSVFSICALPRQQNSTAGGDVLLATTSMDRLFLLWSIPTRGERLDWKAAKVVWRLATLGGHANCLAAQAGAGGMWALGCGDQTVRVWLQGAPDDASLVWRGLPSAASTLAWEPGGRLALGCSSGDVCVCAVGKGMCLPATVRHQAPVRCVLWLSTRDAGPVLVSLCEAGRLLLWRAASLPAGTDPSGSGGVGPVPEDISSTASRLGQDSPATTIASAGECLVVGYADGRLSILVLGDELQAGLLCWALSHSSPVAHLGVRQGTAVAVAHRDGCLACFAFQLGKDAGLTPAAPAYHLGQEPTALAWNSNGLLAVATADKHIQILLTEHDIRPLRKLTGHNAAILALCWSPSDLLQLLSGAEDQTVRAWEVAPSADDAAEPEVDMQTLPEPAVLAVAKRELLAKLDQKPAHKERAGREQEFAAQAAKDLLAASSQFHSGSSAQVLAGMDAQLGGLLQQATQLSRQVARAEEEPASTSNEERRGPLPDTNSDVPAGGGKKKRKDPSLGARPLFLPLETDSTADNSTSCSACLDLASRIAAPPGEALSPDPLQATTCLQEYIDNYKQGPIGAGQAQRLAALELMRGNVAGALRVLTHADCLTSDFVSLAAQAGRAAWVAASKAYAARLEAQGEPQMAALHMLATQDVEGALAVYCRAGLLREAVALAQLRLLPGDARLAELCSAWAEQLQAGGLHAPAAEAFLRGGQHTRAVEALSKSRVEGSAALALQVASLLLESPAVPASEKARLLEKQESLEKETPKASVTAENSQGSPGRTKKYSVEQLLAARPNDLHAILPQPVLNTFPAALRKNR